MSINNELAIYDELKKVAAELSKSSLIPANFKVMQNAWYAILYGRELGLPPIYSLNNVSVINGKPGLSADAMLAICKKSPEYGGCKIEDTDTECKVSMKRIMANNVIDERVVTFSMDDAKKAGLTGSKGGMYEKYPKRMLRARAVAFACRDLFPDVLAGTYSEEERAVVGGDPIKPEYEVLESPDMHRKPVNMADIASAANRCNQLVSTKAIDPDIAADIIRAVREAKASADLDILNSISDEISNFDDRSDPLEVLPEVPAEKPAPKQMLADPLTLKQDVIDTLNKLAVHYQSITHVKNSVKKQLGVEIEADEEWQTAIVSATIDTAKLQAGLEYWQERLAAAEKAKARLGGSND